MTRVLRITVRLLFTLICGPPLAFERTQLTVIPGTVYVEEILEKDKFQPGMFTNDGGDTEKASIDSDLDMFTVQGTKFVLASNAIHM